MSERDAVDPAVAEFLIESSENLARFDQDIVILERDPTSQATVSSMFRAVHTLKGSCGFFGFGTLEKLAHGGEGLLARLRDGEVSPSSDIATALLSFADTAREVLRHIEAAGDEGNVDHHVLIEKLALLKVGGAPPASPVPAASVPVQAATEVVVPTTLRVGVALLDRLMTLAGELVLARNHILQLVSPSGDGLHLASQRLSNVTTELQETIMRARMQPISVVLDRLPRLVRDLALGCGKQVRLELHGGATELDRTVLEAIKDPLTHIVRNAVDHGIECPDVRAARGKHPEGRIVLRAGHRGGHVHLDVQDDGAGLDPERIVRKAVERRLLTPEQIARMSAADLTQLIFTPGFSTAAAVTNVSGRGVGLDVVKSNVDRLGGTIAVDSAPGRGLTLRIRLPLSLTIIPALIVTSGAERYAIPQASLLELVSLAHAPGGLGIELLHSVPVYRLRDRLLPIVDLAGALLPEAAREFPTTRAFAGRNLVVLQADGRPFGLLVDGVNDTEEIVVRPLHGQLRGTTVFTGATILGDGQVALILDVLDLARRAPTPRDGRADRGVGRAPVSAAAMDEQRRFLVVETADDARVAVPGEHVRRLERLPSAAFERAGMREVVQYDGAVLPVIHLSAALGSTKRPVGPPPPTVRAVICRGESNDVCLVVDRILDVVETSAALQNEGKRGGILGSVVLERRVTAVLDVAALARRCAAGGRRVRRSGAGA